MRLFNLTMLNRVTYIIEDCFEREISCLGHIPRCPLAVWYENLLCKNYGPYFLLLKSNLETRTHSFRVKYVYKTSLFFLMSILLTQRRSPQNSVPDPVYIHMYIYILMIFQRLLRMTLCNSRY